MVKFIEHALKKCTDNCKYKRLNQVISKNYERFKFNKRSYWVQKKKETSSNSATSTESNYSIFRLLNPCKAFEMQRNGKCPISRSVPQLKIK